MSKRIACDLFAKVMSRPAGERSDILEFLGQSPVAPNACLTAQAALSGHADDQDEVETPETAPRNY